MSPRPPSRGRAVAIPRASLAPFLTLSLVAAAASVSGCSDFDNKRASVERDPAPAPAPRVNLAGDDDLAPLEKRVAALEAWRARVDATLRDLARARSADANGLADVSALRARMAALEDRLAALAAGGTAGAGGDGARDLAALQGEVSALSGELAAVKARLSALGDAGDAARARLDAVEAWSEETDALLARLRAADLPAALDALRAWKAGVDAAMIDLAAWRKASDARAAAVEALAAATAACVARLDPARGDLPPPTDAERACDAVRTKLDALAALEGRTTDLGASLVDLGDRVSRLERITSARLARLRELEKALLLERWRGQRSLAPCGDDEAFTLTLSRNRVRTTFPVALPGRAPVTSTLEPGAYVHTTPSGGACRFTVAKARRAVVAWEREALGLAADVRSVEVSRVCWFDATQGSAEVCETVFERTVTR